VNNEIYAQIEKHSALRATQLQDVFTDRDSVVTNLQNEMHSFKLLVVAAKMQMNDMTTQLIKAAKAFDEHLIAKTELYQQIRRYREDLSPWEAMKLKPKPLACSRTQCRSPLDGPLVGRPPDLPRILLLVKVLTLKSHHHTVQVVRHLLVIRSQEGTKFRGGMMLPVDL
jgi:hypothetical protein